MIFINLKGGLGNQLFQIFASLNYAISKNQEYIILDSHYKYLNADENTTRRITYWNNLLDKLNDKISSEKVEKNSFNLIREHGYTYSHFPDLNGDIYIDGYFQSYKYFEKRFEKIKEILNISMKQKEIRKKYKSFDYDNACSIHFRIGDYKKFPDHHIILKKNYYEQAIKHIIEKNGKKNFLIFYEKEDEEQVKKIMNSIKKNNNKVRGFTLIDYNIPDHEQLLIMSNCQSNIIANSSFSWWAAYLNSNSRKIVVRPSQWFGPKMKHNDIKDLCPKEWLVIDV